MKKTQCFTLIELLVVIAIIAILAGILLPVIGNTIEKTKITRARTEMQSLITAIKQYESEYDVYPVATYDVLIGILSQTGTYASSGNSRKMRMLDVKKKGEYKDPWGNDYTVIFDTDYDGEINKASVVGFLVPATDPTFLADVLVWSRGGDGKYNSTATHDDNEDNIYSVKANWTKTGGFDIP